MRVQLQKGRELGSGNYGRVYALLTANSEDTGLVCKEVDLDTDISWIHIERESKFDRTLNEIKVLNQLGYLEGYERDGNVFFIIMKKIEGVPGSVLPSPNNLDKLCFEAIRELHRKGIVHFDSNFSNYIISSQNSAKAIDFNFSDDATYINMGVDIYALSLRFGLSFNFRKIVRFYVDDMVKYALEHKFEIAQNLLIIGAVILGAIYGVPALAITHIMVQEFLYTLLINQMGKELTCKGLDILTMLFLRDKEWFRQYVSVQHLENTLSIARSCLSLYLMYCNLAYHWDKSGAFFKNILNFKSNNGLSVFLDVSSETLIHSSLMYYPIIQILARLNKLCDCYVLPEVVLKYKTDLLYKYNPIIFTKYAWSKSKVAVNDVIFPKP